MICLISRRRPSILNQKDITLMPIPDAIRFHYLLAFDQKAEYREDYSGAELRAVAAGKRTPAASNSALDTLRRLRTLFA